MCRGQQRSDDSSTLDLPFLFQSFSVPEQETQSLSAVIPSPASSPFAPSGVSHTWNVLPTIPFHSHAENSTLDKTSATPQGFQESHPLMGSKSRKRTLDFVNANNSENGFITNQVASDLQEIHIGFRAFCQGALASEKPSLRRAVGFQEGQQCSIKSENKCLSKGSKAAVTAQWSVAGYFNKNTTNSTGAPWTNPYQSLLDLPSKHFCPCNSVFLF